MVLSNLRCRPEPSDEAVAAMLAPERRPAEVARREPSAFVFAPEKGLKLLGEQVADTIELLGRKRAVAEAADASSRERALNRALVLKDEAEARLFFRYHAESRSTFHRAYKELVATLERDETEPADAGETDSPNEPDSQRVGPEATGEVEAAHPSDVAREEPASPNEPDAPESPNEPDEAESPNEPTIEAAASTGPREEVETSVENTVRPGVAPVGALGAEEGSDARYADLEREVFERYPMLRDQWVTGSPPASI
jgi:hypothetical protein